MRQFIFAIIITCFGGLAFAEPNIISFQERQPSTPMKVTSVSLSPSGGTINAEGTMGEYGRVYLTYKLTADANGKGGVVHGEGRGATKDGNFQSGTGSGSYYRDGTKFIMHVIFRISDGTQNLDKIVFDSFSRTMSHDVYIAK
jgi:hypothetical protein